MQAIITAAARSPRLLPLTKHKPVSLLEVRGKAILARQIEALEQAGIRDRVVITGFGADQVEQLCAGRASCVFNPFYEICNVAMHLWLVREDLGSGFVLIYDDILFEANLIKEVVSRGNDILLVVDPRSMDREAEKVVLQNGLVKAIGKDVTKPFGEFIGVAMFPPNAISALVSQLEHIARTNLGTTFPQLIQGLVENGLFVNVLATDRPWSDIDFPADLEEAHRLWHD